MPIVRRLIEVDFPIERVSDYSRREKAVRQGHLSSLHLWWARRPLSACRAIVCGSLWIDPADENCPAVFRAKARSALVAFYERVFPKRINAEGQDLKQNIPNAVLERWQHRLESGSKDAPDTEESHLELREDLLDFIAEFSNWDNSTLQAFLDTSRAITTAAYQSTNPNATGRPLVVDPFAGGGAIPLEAVRVGADAFASDLNPLPVLLNKVSLEYIPRFGKQLPKELAKWASIVRERLVERVGRFYLGEKGEEIIAYIWARTIISAAPGESEPPVEVPMLRSMWLCKKGKERQALRWVRNADASVKHRLVQKTFANGTTLKVRQPLLEVFQPSKERDVENGTAARGSVTCPITGYTTNVKTVRDQLGPRGGGADDARLCCVVALKAGFKGRVYRVPNDKDEARVSEAVEFLKKTILDNPNVARLVPTEVLPLMSGVFNAPIYGHTTWRSLFAPRQLLALATLSQLIRDLTKDVAGFGNTALAKAVQTLLAFALDKQADLGNALCRWEPIAQCPRQLFGRQAIGMVWDFAEGNPAGSSSGSFEVITDGLVRSLEKLICDWPEGHVAQADAMKHPLPDDSAACLITDPPYYNAVPYADLSDFFYVWLKRTIGDSFPELFAAELAPKDQEICEMAGWDPVRYKQKDGLWYEERMKDALTEARRVVAPDGIGVIVFAHKSTAGWEAQLQAIINAGWTIECSWPIDTENTSRLRAQGSAALGSSIHLVCRPREHVDGSVNEMIGEWRDILAELPLKIRVWMRRLHAENVVGADAIFSCLGPALEVYSRYSQVEKSNGEAATLREYLEHVWGTISTEALSMIFQSADAVGLEPDARLTAMWLWTLSVNPTNGSSTVAGAEGEETESDPDGDDEESSPGLRAAEFMLEFDVARKIAQGLGVHLEQCESLVQIIGDKARLLPVGERAQFLFGKGAQAGKSTGRKKKPQQKTLFAELDEAEAAEAGWSELRGPAAGSTILDRVHQAMILFAANRTELLKRFLVEDGVGKDTRFWKLADNLNRLYPPGTEERRWIEGVLARKKGLGQ